MNKPVQAVVLHHFSVSAERVFDAWLNPSMLDRWMFGPNVREERIVKLRLDPKRGGKFSFVVERNGTEVDHVGEYLEIDHARRLSFTWGTRDNFPETSKATVEIVPRDQGCDVKRTHDMSPKWAGSWTGRLEALDRLLQCTLLNNDHLYIYNEIQRPTWTVYRSGRSASCTYPAWPHRAHLGIPHRSGKAGSLDLRRRA